MLLDSALDALAAAITEMMKYQADALDVLTGGQQQIAYNRTTPVYDVLNHELITYREALLRVEAALKAIEATRTAFAALLEIGYNILPTIAASQEVLTILDTEDARNHKARKQLVVTGATHVEGEPGPLQRPTPSS